MSFKKLTILGIALLCLLSCSEKQSSGQNKPTEEPVLPDITVSRISSTSEGKPYLEVDGKPFALYGVQIRLDLFKSADKLTWDEIEVAFEKAAGLGVNCVQVTYPWAFLQPASENRFVFTEIDKVMELCNKYNIKMELLWFSTNMIGDSYSWLVPPYILLKDNLKMQRDGDGWDHYLYGKTYSLIFNDEWLMRKEREALTKLFSHIRYWDSVNGEKHPVIACQIHNEPCALARWRLKEKNIGHKDGSPFDYKAAWKMTLEALDNAGKAVQNSNYKVATRTNLIAVDGSGVNDFYQTPGCSPKDVYALEGIDFVSYDPYMDNMNKLCKEVSAYASIPGNYPLIAENRGSYLNSPSLILAASALGAGYDIYDLVPSKAVNDNATPPFVAEGVFAYGYEEMEHTSSVRILLKGLTQVAEEIAVTPTEDFAVFNVTDDYPQQSIDQTVSTTGAYLRFQSECKTPGFALDLGDEIVAFSIYDACLTVSGGTTPDYGGGVVPLKGGQVYHIRYNSAGTHASNVKKYIGTIFN